MEKSEKTYRTTYYRNYKTKRTRIFEIIITRERKSNYRDEPNPGRWRMNVETMKSYTTAVVNSFYRRSSVDQFFFPKH